MVGDAVAVPKEGDAPLVDGEGNASLPQKTEDVPPFFRENVAEHIPQHLPLKEGCAVGAEPVVDLREGLREGGCAEAVGQLEQHGGIGGDGEGNVVSDGDGGHDKPLSAPFSRETLLYLLPRLME